MKKFHITLLALAGSLLVSACGGGSSADTTPAVSITAVKVFGDSLADSGTFGLKFTVQSPDSLIYPERIAAAYGQTLCNFYTFTGVTFAPNPKAGCSNFAIGGGVINSASLAAADPRRVPVQLATAAAVGSFSPTDLVVIDGGGNDAADLVGAYLTIPRDGGAAYMKLLGTLLTPAQVGAIMSGGASTIAAGGATYMLALADLFHASIKANVLDKSAQRVVILNMPSITNTPRFQMVLDGIAAASGGGTAGATARAQSDALFRSWMTAFNKQLDSKYAGESKVAIVDFYSGFNDQVNFPAQFSLSNVKTPACPATGMGADGLPTYTFETCTAKALSAAPPAGVSGADWWKSYAFSDGFHPTPYGHQLLGQLVSKAIAIKGWL
ncbi:phospholipase [Paucibacter sp. TC2R-5]|uniref:SGNH/GDSL hydrolase family protein n=1 Tax=Paucibacter sp. TC2R-5 TaxID=2893555 RepID=UPI0021E47FCD|nr:SGNH/GDSL hydrolase family protein [Paucibacter sp. TC2R-5]MCV2358534.1 phospholipase [Paucibacter sp. TC2R-5]